VISIQATVAALAAALTYAVFAPTAAKAVWYGAAVALANALFLIWRMRLARANRMGRAPAVAVVLPLQPGAIFLVAVLLAGAWVC